MEGLAVLALLAVCCGLPLILFGGGALLKGGAKWLNRLAVAQIRVQSPPERRGLDGTQDSGLSNLPDGPESERNAGGRHNL